jgi:hypothetical protein
VVKWAIELLPLDIKFEAKKAIKSQALVDFLVEWMEQEQPLPSLPEHWMMFFDGSKMIHRSGLEWSWCALKATDSTMCFRFTLTPPTMKSSMKLSYMGCGLQFLWEFAD